MRSPRIPIALPLLTFLLFAPAARAALFTPDGAGGGAAVKDACTVLVAVRHAEKDSGDDPGLTEAGRARAKALADALAHAHVQVILVSPTRRTRETAAPTAAHARVEPREISLEGGTDAHVAALARAVKAEGGKTVLVVGHSNTIPPLLRALKMTANDMSDKEYGELFVATLCPATDPRLIKASFGAPAGDAPHADRAIHSPPAPPRGASIPARAAARP
ncbi:MAG TPA: phosphoglycerate mutase family protein [Candidatus Polarisedimenticolaceae bacterium]|nr:phosphoglycerate mutase family protein [Candidatus Polarisedimenticolaceae bacterium]